MSSGDLDGKVALVTGATRGIGRVIAEDLSGRGAHVVINSGHSISMARTVAEEMPGPASAVEADVADPDAVAEMRRTIEASHATLDILVNNAGEIVRPAAWDSYDQTAWERTINVNLGGVFNVTREFRNMLQASGGGRIVNIASTYGQTGAAPVAAYTAAKAGVVNLTLGLAKELAPTVTVNAVSPGNIDTEMTRGAGQEVIDWVISETPLGRLGSPEDVAAAVGFLVGPTGGFITGHVLVVDGGFMLA